MIELLIGFVVGAALGAAGYRYWLKRNPEALEALAQKFKALGDKVG